MRYKDTALGSVPENWEIETMENALEVIIDYRGKTPQKSDTGILTLSAKSVKTGFIDYNNAYCISPETYKKFMVRGIPKLGDILMTTEAPLGCIAKLDSDGVGIAQRLLTLRGKKNYLLNDYLMYYLVSDIGQHQLNARASGTTVIGIKQSEFRKVLIPIPPICEQKAIAETLSCLDDKIELNNKINANLEQTAQAIFKSWFVDFEPFQDGEFVESELGRIPKGWRVVEFSKIVKVINGYSYKGQELQPSSIAMATIKNFDRNGGFKLDGFKEIIPSEKVKGEHFAEVFDVLVAHTDITQNADIIGNGEMLLSKTVYKKIVLSMDLVKVKSLIPQLNNFLLASIFKDQRFKDYALGYVNGTTVLHLSKKAIPEYKIALPADFTILEQLGDLLAPLYKTIASNVNENFRLSELRNILLPKLMSGKIDVSQV